MKRTILLLLFVAALFTSCDPEWALDPRNQAGAYIINKTETDITFRAYSFTERLHCQYTISSGDTVRVSGATWDERENNWKKMVKAGWDPFLATVAKRDYSGITEDFDVYHQRISIVTSPTDSLSWTFDVNNIEESSIFNESNWIKEEDLDDGYFNFYSWYYLFE